mmetsp:Transcript_7412/g.15879  ORF Transcript_7412/g.15879 Transcript_7412/m.15879 type:complete len:280 (-) Transcript_7412:271-1110(-)
MHIIRRTMGSAGKNPRYSRQNIQNPMATVGSTTSRPTNSPAMGAAPIPANVGLPSDTKIPPTPMSKRGGPARPMLSMALYRKFRGLFVVTIRPLMVGDKPHNIPNTAATIGRFTHFGTTPRTAAGVHNSRARRCSGAGTSISSVATDAVHASPRSASDIVSSCSPRCGSCARPSAAGAGPPPATAPASSSPVGSGFRTDMPTPHMVIECITRYRPTYPSALAASVSKNPCSGVQIMAPSIKGMLFPWPTAGTAAKTFLIPRGGPVTSTPRLPTTNPSIT